MWNLDWKTWCLRSKHPQMVSLSEVNMWLWIWTYFSRESGRIQNGFYSHFIRCWQLKRPGPVTCWQIDDCRHTLDSQNSSHLPQTQVPVFRYSHKTCYSRKRVMSGGAATHMSTTKSFCRRTLGDLFHTVFDKLGRISDNFNWNFKESWEIRLLYFETKQSSTLKSLQSLPLWYFS